MSTAAGLLLLGSYINVRKSAGSNIFQRGLATFKKKTKDAPEKGKVDICCRLNR